MPSKRTLEWRTKNSAAIFEWRQKIADLRNLSNLESWSYEKLEIEIAQLLHPKLREIYDFATSYSRRYKKGPFKQYMDEAVAEIVEYGSIEPSRYQDRKSVV